MENTLYIALSQQMALRRHMDVVANNLANISTAGFKGEHTMFVQYLKKSGDGEQLAFVQDIAVLRDFREGPLTSTGKPLDVAITGEGWFTVSTPQGQRFTRNGEFRLDAQGQMTDVEGNPVLDEGGNPIVFQPDDGAPTIAGDGTISANGQARGRLGVVTFENDQMLRKIARNLYDSTAAPRPAENARVVQGMIEGSNVEPIVELANMIQVARKYDGTQGLIDAEDKRMREAIQSLTQQNA